MGFDGGDVHVLDPGGSRWFRSKGRQTKESKCDAVTLTS